MDGIIRAFDLHFDQESPEFIKSDFWNKTLFGQRRELADYFRLQMYGFMWAATGIDQVYPTDYKGAQVDLEADTSFHNFAYPILDENGLAFPEMEAGINAAGSNNILIINEPILVSNGENSDVRYNFYYPRWAYDQYRNTLNDKAFSGGWNYLDLWDLIPESYFTNSAIHINSAGEILMAQKILDYISGIPCQ